MSICHNHSAPSPPQTHMLPRSDWRGRARSQRSRRCRRLWSGSLFEQAPCLHPPHRHHDSAIVSILRGKKCIAWEKISLLLSCTRNLGRLCAGLWYNLRSLKSMNGNPSRQAITEGHAWRLRCMTRFALALPHQALAEFCRRWKIRELALFGSALREDFRPESDIDLLVTFDD